MGDLDQRGIDAVAYSLAQEMWAWSADRWENPSGQDVFKKMEFVSRATSLIETYMKAVEK